MVGNTAFILYKSHVQSVLSRCDKQDLLSVMRKRFVVNAMKPVRKERPFSIVHSESGPHWTCWLATI
jgi:hypothetical protein